MEVLIAFVGVCTLLYGKYIIKKRHFRFWSYAYNPMLQFQLELFGWKPEYRGKQAVKIGQWYVMGSYFIFGLAAIALVLHIYFLFAIGDVRREVRETLGATEQRVDSRNSNSRSGSHEPGFDIMRTELPQPSRSLPFLQYDATSREFVEGASGPNWRASGRSIMNWSEDFAPENGFLVGMDVGRDQSSKSIVGIVPIYQVGSEYRRGKLLGKSSADWIRLVADPGQVVTGVRSELDSAIQLMFGELRPDGTIDPANPRESNVVGKEYMGLVKKEFNRPISGLRIAVPKTLSEIKAIEFVLPEIKTK